MILESIVTTVNRAGEVNVAPMGVIPEGERFTLKPYRETTTYRNLLEQPYAVVNFVDDAEVYARSALGPYEAPWRPAVRIPGAVLASTCSWVELEVLSMEGDAERAVIACQAIYRGRFRDFVGYNRARNAILEATILATRTRFLPMEEIQTELERLAVIVRKCGDEPELRTMAFIMNFVRRCSV